MSSSSISAIPPYGSQFDPTRSAPSRGDPVALAASRPPAEPRSPLEPREASSGPTVSKAADPPVSLVRPLELSVGRSRDGTGVIIDLLVPPNSIPFARVFGTDDPPPSLDVKA